MATSGRFTTVRVTGADTERAVTRALGEPKKLRLTSGQRKGIVAWKATRSASSGRYVGKG